MVAVDNLIDEIQRNGFALINDFISYEFAMECRKEYFSALMNLRPNPPKQSFTPIQLNNAPWRKYAIGSKNGSGDPYSQILQTTYFSEKTPGFEKTSLAAMNMVYLRNEICNLPQGYGFNLSEDHFWNALRIHHYPSGGGHMAEHRDSRFPKYLENAKIPFLQLILTLTEKGVDFDDGGGFLIDRAENKIFLEAGNKPGTLVLFDGSISHGVEDVDPSQLIDFKSTRGRIALLVGLYPNLQHKSY